MGKGKRHSKDDDITVKELIIGYMLTIVVGLFMVKLLQWGPLDIPVHKLRSITALVFIPAIGSLVTTALTGLNILVLTIAFFDVVINTAFNLLGL